MVAILLLVSGIESNAADTILSGYVSLEPRYFFDEPLFPEQPAAGVSASAVLAPELHYQWNGGNDRLTISPYFRIDADDDNRTHADLREAIWVGVRGAWTWQVGIGRVFWGVTESRHLVDIVNQFDRVDDIDDEDKLGQPLISVERWFERAGTFTGYLLPGFRERTFPAANARLRGSVPIDTDRPEYQSDAKGRRLDVAGRWSNAIGSWDLGITGFHGTSREPQLLPSFDAAGKTVLIPRYQVIFQAGLDLQYTWNAWLWKLEGLVREGQGKTFGALVAGFEYTLYNLGSEGADLGVLVEYQYDGRDSTAPPTPYDDNWFFGLRLGLNDVDDSSILAGIITDREGSLGFVEAERRLGERWKLELEARLFINVDPLDPLLGGFSNDSFLTVRIARYL